MEIKILFFGITAELVNEQSLNLNIEKNTSVKDLKEKIKNDYQKLKNINDFAIAINETYANDQQIVCENDVVAIIPPVSGG